MIEETTLGVLTPRFDAQVIEIALRIGMRGTPNPQRWLEDVYALRPLLRAVGIGRYLPNTGAEWNRADIVSSFDLLWADIAAASNIDMPLPTPGFAVPAPALEPHLGAVYALYRVVRARLAGEALQTAEAWLEQAAWYLADV